jgi:hypothetical protein
MLKVEYSGKFADVVYRSFECTHALGDTWAATNYFLRISERLRKPIRVNAHFQSFKDFVLNIRPYFNSSGRIQFVDDPFEHKIGYCQMYSIGFLPTKIRWKRSKSNIIAYQFDGKDMAEYKNLPPDVLANLLKSLNSRGYNTINVGGMKPMPFIIKTLAKCKLFVGCPSGLSHVAMSVKCPINLISWKIPQFRINRIGGGIRGCQFLRDHATWFRTPEEFLKSIKSSILYV